MEELKVFENAEFGSVRTTTLNGEIMFVGKDVAEILGYSNPRKAIIDHIDEEDKGVTKCDTLGGKQDLTMINESGLYSLILSSKMPNAKKFKHWVTADVLPAIRKTGMYATEELLENPDLAIQAFTALKLEREKNKKLNTTVKVQEQQIMELQPKASYYDLVLNCPDLLSVTVIAKDYGKSAKWLNNFLKEHKIQFKQGKIWLLYKEYAEQGYTSTKTHTVNGNDGKQHSKVNTYWTQKGRLFVKERGYTSDNGTGADCLIQSNRTKNEIHRLKQEVEIMEAEKTKKARKPRKQPKVHVEVVGSWQDRPAYERFQHWKPHIENMYHMLGYGDVTVEPSQEMIDEYNAIQANKEKGA